MTEQEAAFQKIREEGGFDGMSLPRKRKGGRRSRDKGNRGERQIVNWFQDAGIAAERIPLSGSAGGSFSGDVTVPIQGQDRVFEAKVRADGFKQLYDWLGANYGLFVRSDRNAQLVVLRLSDFIALIRGK